NINSQVGWIGPRAARCPSANGAMQTSGARRLIRLLAGVALSVLVWGAFAPAWAAASCGDYVTVTHGANQDGTTGRSTATHPAPGQPVPAHPDRPCHGPTCSSDDLPPPPPPPAPVRGGETLWVCPVGPLDLRSPFC